MDKQSNPHGKSAVAKRMAELGIRAAIWDARVTAAYLGISRSCLYNYVRDGRIGRPIRLGPNRTGFRREDIEKWVANRQAA